VTGAADAATGAPPRRRVRCQRPDRARRATVWAERASTGQPHRRPGELVGHLFRADVHPYGVILSTGTCLVPDESVTLRTGDPSASL